jgi:excisionase family DNA binding protein
MSKNTYTDWSTIPLFLTVPEAAALLRIHDNSVRKMISDGKLPAFKAGRAWRVKRDDVRALTGDNDQEADHV